MRAWRLFFIIWHYISTNVQKCVKIMYNVQKQSSESKHCGLWPTSGSWPISWDRTCLYLGLPLQPIMRFQTLTSIVEISVTYKPKCVKKTEPWIQWTYQGCGPKSWCRQIKRSKVTKSTEQSIEAHRGRGLEMWPNQRVCTKTSVHEGQVHCPLC